MEEQKKENPQEQPAAPDLSDTADRGEDILEEQLPAIDKEVEKNDEALEEADKKLEENTSEDTTSESLESEDIKELESEMEKDEKELEKVDKEIEATNKDIESNKPIPDHMDETQALIDELKEEKKEEPKQEAPAAPSAGDDFELTTEIYALRTTANREDQVMDFITSNAEKRGFKVYSVIRAHGMRGYVFVEAESKADAEQAAFNVPYARGILPKQIEYAEIEHMLEQVKKEVNIQQNDIVEIISGPFKRENAKIIRIDKSKEEVVVELLEAAVPIPITLKLDAVKVIRRDNEEQ